MRIKTSEKETNEGKETEKQSGMKGRKMSTRNDLHDILVRARVSVGWSQDKGQGQSGLEIGWPCPKWRTSCGLHMESHGLQLCVFTKFMKPTMPQTHSSLLPNSPCDRPIRNQRKSFVDVESGGEDLNAGFSQHDSDEDL